MESQQFAKTIELKSMHGPIKIERLQPQHKTSSHHGQLSYSFTRNCTSLNLQFISIQKMDNVLHSIQRRIYKQKEQRVFAEFIKSNYASTQSKSNFVQIDSGQVCFERGSKETIHCRNGSTKVHVNSDTSSSTPKEGLSNENYMMKELVDELKMCITALNAAASRDNNVGFNSGDKSSFHQKRDKKPMTVSRKSHTMQNRPKFQNTYPLGIKTIQKPQQLKKAEHKPKKIALKIKSPADKNMATDFKSSSKSIVLAKNSIQGRQILPIKDVKRAEESPGKAVDALALWKSLSKMEKVEELVRRNLEMMNADENRQVKAMEKKEIVADIGTNVISPGYFGTSTSLYDLGDASSADRRCKLETKEMNTKAPTRRPDYRFGHPNVSMTRFLTPNSDIVDEIKTFSNNLVDELLNEVSNEILDLPEAFLIELLETEFANNNTHMKVG